MLATSEHPAKVRNASSDHWLARWRAFRAEAASAGPAEPGDPPRLVLLGDSMIERFPTELESDLGRYEVINRGIGGDKIGGWAYFGVLDRLDVSVEPWDPAAVVLLIGVNDVVFAGTPEASTSANARRLLAELARAAPRAEVLVVSVLPVRGEAAEHNAAIDRLSADLRAASAGQGARFLDIADRFRDGKGRLDASLAEDDIHLNDTGYRLLASALRERLNGNEDFR